MTTTVVPTWTLADRLVKARQVAGYTQAEFAAVTGISLATIKRYESGTHNPKRAMVLGWSVACGVDPDWLETGNYTPDADESGTMPVTKGYLVAA